MAASYNGSIAGAEPENGGSIPHAATFALIAQLVEHLAHNRTVVGSRPTGGTIPIMGTQLNAQTGQDGSPSAFVLYMPL